MTVLYFAKLLPAIIAALTATIIGLYRRKELDRASAILVLYTGAGFLVEVIAIYAAVKYHNNMPVYAVYSLLEFGLVAAYFNYSVAVLRPLNIGLFIGILGAVIGILNIIFMQPLTVLNSYFLYFEGIAVIGLSLFSFFRLLLMSDSLQLARLRHFWFPLILCFFWTITFFNWGLYEYFNANLKDWTWLINLSINIVSCLTYSAIAIVFWYYPKLQITDE